MSAVRDAVIKARRSLNAPANRYMAGRRLKRYVALAQTLPEGDARRAVAIREAQRLKSYLDTGKFGRGMTAGRQEFEAARAPERKPGQAVSARYRGKLDGDLNNDGKPDNQPKARKPKAKAADDELNPTSDAYRYKDTGYVAGSRKELAADMIRQSAKSGNRLRVTDIDWKSIEENPREAAALITKSNLFGQVDWAKHRADGMTPEAGFLIDRVYASVGKGPVNDTPQGRKDYALGLESLRDRLEKAKTTDEVVAVVDGIREEMRGKMLTDADSSIIANLTARRREGLEKIRPLQAELDASYKIMSRADSDVSRFKYEASKRERRGWKPDPEISASLATAEQSAAKLRADYTAVRDRVKPQLDELEKDYRSAGNAMTMVEAAATARSADHPTKRAWNELGPRFAAVANFRSQKGSAAFRDHVTSAKVGRIKDWSWADQETMTATKERKESVRFQLQVADTHERIGGRAVDIASTADLKTRFKLREVQSGNWVLRDVAAAKFHTEQTAGALSDLADIIGAPDGEVSLNGRVALAFGARGTGNAGGSSARAHWEPVQRVINLTKMSGGGTLAHEWFHALDNLVIEMEAARPGKVSDYATENDGLPDGELKQAFTALRSAMMQGDVQARRRFAYTANDVRLAVANVDRSNYGLGLKIKQAGDAEAAIRAVEETFPEKSLSRRGMRKRRDQWLGIAAAHFGRQADGGEVSVKAGPRMSRFAVEAEKLDTMTSKSGRKYWAQPREMAARAFQSYVEDRLSGQGRRNDYLSARADNRWYRLLGPFAPFPEGEERARINQAFDDLFAALRRRGTLRKALRGLRARGTQYKPGLWNVAETTVSTPKWNNPIGRAIGPRRKATLRTTFQDDGNDVKVFGTDPIPEKMRGYGAGVKHYEGMIRRASARGGALVSDHNVSPEAKRVYGALARRGYKVSQDATSGRYRVSKSRTHGPYTIKTKGKRAEAHLDGKRVGWAVVKPNLFRPMSLEGVAVDAEHRRKGLATAMSNALEAKHRRKIKDALPLTREGKAFWANRTVRKDMSPILREAVKKAARSLNAPKNKRQAARRAALYDRVAQNSPNGPAARIAGMEAARNRGVAAGGKYGRGMTEGRAFEEKARASRAYRDDVRSQGRKPRNDKNNDGWVDGQRPTGAKPRKTAASLSVEAITPNARSRSTGEAIGAKASDAKANLMAISRLDGASLRQMAKDNPTTLNWALDAKMTLPQLRRVHQSLTGQRLPETAGLSDHKKAIRAALPGMGSQGRLVVRDTVQATTAKEVASRGAKAKQERKPSNFRIDESVRDPDGLTPNQRSYLDRRKAQAQKEYDAAMASPVGNRFGKPTGEDRYKSDLAELRSKPNKDRNTKWQADTLAMQTQMATSKPEAPWKSQWYRPDRISGVQTGAYSAGGEIRDWDRNAMALGEADAKTGTFAPGNLRGHSRYSYEMAWATARANRKIRKAIRHAIRKMLAPSAYRLAA